MIMLTEHFALTEFRCKCGCGKNEINEMLVDALERLRCSLGRPIRVLSGYRCHSHNADIGGTAFSFHCRGMAVDVSCDRGWQALYEAARRTGLFHGIGIYPQKNFVHLDIRQLDARWGEWNGKRVSLPYARLMASVPKDHPCSTV